MTDFGIVSAGINLILAIAVFYFARKKDTKEDSAQQAEIVVQMRGVREDVADIKADMKAMHNDWKKDHDDIVKMKSSLEAMWKRIDDYAKKEKTQD